MRALTDTEDNRHQNFTVLFLYLPIHPVLSLSPLIDSLGNRAHGGEYLMCPTFASLQYKREGSRWGEMRQDLLMVDNY